ncbi:MAG: tripartite tricarboxylate transporter substrate-binding protein, partial [Pygmaiobacter massiliensis]|nr:tripartite tricarboxylate transporter substrate-binding protein [Pygmaiobacter massiliensis]
NNLNDLIAAAKAAPGTIKAGITNAASSQFIFGALEKEGDIDLKLVDGGSEADKLTSLQGGLLDISVVSAKAAIEYAKAGKIKVLASIAEERTPGLDYPTTVEQGFKSVTWDVGVILLGPPNMDPALVEQISQSLSGITTDEKSKELIENMGGTAEYMNAADSLTRMEARDAQIGEMATALGINVR